MKSSPSLATVLILIMLLMVVAAGFVFLFQAELRFRDHLRILSAENETLRGERANIELELSGAVATRDALAAGLAAAEGDTRLLEGQHRLHVARPADQTCFVPRPREQAAVVATHRTGPHYRDLHQVSSYPDRSGRQLYPEMLRKIRRLTAGSGRMNVLLSFKGSATNHQPVGKVDMLG